MIFTEDEAGYKGLVQLKDVIRQNWMLAESDCRKGPDLPAWSLGDFFTSMLRPGEVVLVSGLAGSGLTSVALNTALAFAAQRSGMVVIHAVEFDPRHIAARLLNSALGIPLSSLIGIDSANYRLPTSAASLLSSNIHIDDRLYEGVEAANANYEGLEGLGLIVIDNIRLLSPNEQVHGIAMQLKKMSLSLGIPILVADHASIGIIGRSKQAIWPSMQDIRKRGVSLQDLDTIVSIYRECECVGQREYEFDEAEDAACKIRLLKSCHGQTGTMPVSFSREKLRFEKGGEFVPRHFDQCS